MLLKKDVENVKEEKKKKVDLLAPVRPFGPSCLGRFIFYIYAEKNEKQKWKNGNSNNMIFYGNNNLYANELFHILF